MQKRYQVKCGSCGGTRVIDIHSTDLGQRIDWLEDRQEGAAAIISGRQRLDMQWGFQCVCGNNDLMTNQERATFSNPASPKPQELDQVLKNLVTDKPKFEMVEA